MRRKDREITQRQEILQIIEKCKVCRLGLYDGKEVYMVPMNFGYTYEFGKLIFYFHCADDGRKLDIIKENHCVAFEMDCSHELITGDTACMYSYRYECVMGTGMAFFTEEPEQKAYALERILRHHTGQRIPVSEEAADKVTVFQVNVHTLSCKRHE